MNKTIENYRNLRYRKHIYKKHVPSLTCPYCRKSTLQNHNEIRSIETKRSEVRRGEYHLDIGYETEIYFSGFLSCGLCEEKTAVIGVGWVECEGEGCENPLLDKTEYFTAYMPKYFYPTVQLFEVPEKTPEAVKKALNESFSIAWADFSGTANKLRKTIEQLICSVAPNLVGNSLHSKIKNLEAISEYKDISIMLMAIKWLGNKGSHASVELQEYDIAFAFNVIEKILNNLYVEKVDFIKISSEINEKRGSLIK